MNPGDFGPGYDGPMLVQILGPLEVLYEIADGITKPGEGDPTVVICMDEFGPLNLQPHPGKQWAATIVGKGDTEVPRRRRRRRPVRFRAAEARPGHGTFSLLHSCAVLCPDGSG